MNTRAHWLTPILLLTLGLTAFCTGAADLMSPFVPAAGTGEIVRRAQYRLELPRAGAKSMVVQFNLAIGTNETSAADCVELTGTKANGEHFEVWLLSAGYPAADLRSARNSVLRYVLREGTQRAEEFRDSFSLKPVLPSVGGWRYLLPRREPGSGVQDGFASVCRYLGHRYKLQGVETNSTIVLPADIRMIELLPDSLIGTASNTRQKDEKRRYDNSDYELVRLTRADYREMFNSGLNCFKVDAEQLPWVQELGAFYWGVDGGSLPYPECLYRSTYLGPTLFVDEPAVGTRDYVIRPQLAKEEAFKQTITPQIVFEAFQGHYHEAIEHGAPQVLFNSLKARTDVDLGEAKFNQANLFSWETMVSSAAYQLTQDPEVPEAMVFEPPGRVGTWRTLPELDMTYGCQLPIDDPQNLANVIYGFLRGAARVSGKSWGTSIYGSVDRADAFWLLTHAYDLGATRFFFWDNARSACVPYPECLALAKHLRAHAENFPHRNLPKLAEAAILLPPGYNLGHVHLGRGNLWGLGELNLERTNHYGVSYRRVMANFFTEIERCSKLGVAFDLFWDLPNLKLRGYREIVRVREDGQVHVQEEDGHETVLSQARGPMRPDGIAPVLQVELSPSAAEGRTQITATAQVTETSAPVYYTRGADYSGIYSNAYVMWELYGPAPEDYHLLTPHDIQAGKEGAQRRVTIVARFEVNRPGTYRLRAATVDMAGRSTVVWKSFSVRK